MYLLLGLVAFFLVTLPIIFRFEKRSVWPYGELQAQPCGKDSSGYAARTVREATRSGYSLLGWAPDRRGGIYELSYAVLISADRTILAVISVGTIGKLSLQGTWLYTPAADGRTFYSTDNQSGVQLDLSRNWTSQLVPKASFQKLLSTHQEWLQSLGVVTLPFKSGKEMEDFRALRERHFRSMERAGLIQFTDPAAAQFQFTTSGAIRTAHWSYALGLVRAVTGGRVPRSA